jgi:hypothetical protein
MSRRNMSALEKEEWKTLTMNSNYQISNYGRIKNVIKGNIINNKITRVGYEQTNVWAVSPDGTRKKINKSVAREVFMHFIGPIPDGLFVDHVDGNRRNNHISNLRLATNGQNQANSKLRDKTGQQSKYKGVDYRPKCANKPWRASLRSVKGDFYKQFATEYEAAVAYDLRLIELYGEYASTNILKPV